MSTTKSRAISSALIFLLFLTSLTTMASANTTKNTENVSTVVIVDGQKISTPIPAFHENEVTWVPLIPVMQSFGAQTQWNSQSREISIRTSNDSSFVFRVGSQSFNMNGTSRVMTSTLAPRIINGSIFVPLSLIGTMTQSHLTWASAANAAVISSPSFLNELDYLRGRSDLTIPDRRLTQSERNTWMSEYIRLGGELDFEAVAIDLINDLRKEHGLSPLVSNQSLMMAARFKSQSMSDLNYYSHEGVYDSPTNLAAVFGFSGGVGENLYRGPTSPIWAVHGWNLSPGHRELMLSPDFTEIGVGIFSGTEGAFYWTMLAG